MVNNNAKHILINGIVQGVGFRPFVYQLALKYSIKGKISNTSEGVSIHAEGREKDIERFLNDLKNIKKIKLNKKPSYNYEKYCDIKSNNKIIYSFSYGSDFYLNNEIWINEKYYKIDDKRIVLLPEFFRIDDSLFSTYLRKLNE